MGLSSERDNDIILLIHCTIIRNYRVGHLTKMIFFKCTFFNVHIYVVYIGSLGCCNVI